MNTVNIIDHLRYNDNLPEEKAEIVDKNYIHDKYNGTNIDHIENLTRDHKMLSEIFQSLTVKIETLARGYLSELLEKFILEAHQHGILVFLQRKVSLLYDFKYQLDSKTEILTIYMLSAGFSIWLGTVLIACIVFVGERIVFQIVGIRILLKSRLNQQD